MSASVRCGVAAVSSKKKIVIQTTFNQVYSVFNFAAHVEWSDSPHHRGSKFSTAIRLHTYFSKIFWSQAISLGNCCILLFDLVVDNNELCVAHFTDFSTVAIFLFPAKYLQSFPHTPKIFPCISLRLFLAFCTTGYQHRLLIFFFPSLRSYLNLDWCGLCSAIKVSNCIARIYILSNFFVKHVAPRIWRWKHT